MEIETFYLIFIALVLIGITGGLAFWIVLLAGLF